MEGALLTAVLQVATLLASLATVLSVVVGVRIYRRQMNAQVFLAYTQRYEAIMSHLPSEARRARLDTSGALPPRSEELTLGVLRYLNLCSEEYYLCRSGHLDRSLWAIWEDELKRTVRSPLVRREWPELRAEFASYSAFAQFVDRLLAESAPPRVATAGASAEGGIRASAAAHPARPEQPGT